MMDVINLNRILLDDIKDVIIDNKNKIITANINDNYDILINDSDYKYNFIFNNSKSNVFLNVKETHNLNFDIIINKSEVVLNIIDFDGVNVLINVKIKGENSSLEIYNSQVTKKTIKIDMNINHLSSNTVSNVYNCVVTKNDSNCDVKVISKVERGIKYCKVNQDSKIISYNKINKNA